MDPQKRFPILASYSYVKKDAGLKLFKRASELNCYDILLDSGAYTAYASGSVINIEEYIEFCHRWKKKLWGYAALDVIKDPSGTKENLKIMLRNNLYPLPVHTIGNTQKELNWMYSKSDLVMIGGISGGGTRARAILKEKMAWVKGRKVHWFGYTIEPMMRTFKPYSVDTTNWLSGTRYGVLNLYLGNGRWETLQRSDLLQEGKINQELKQKVGRALETCGFTWADLTDRERWINNSPKLPIKRCLTAQVNTYSWYQYCQEYMERFKTRIFLAGHSTNRCMDQALEGWVLKFREGREYG